MLAKSGSSRLRVVREEAGISLIEIMIALSILATVLVALGGLMFQMARHTRQSAAVAYRSAASTSAATWIERLPWNSIDGAVGCTTDTSGFLIYDRCVTVQNISANQKRVTVAISPTGQLIIPPDSVVVDRTRPKPPSTLKVN